MNMIRKIAGVLGCAVITASLCACGGGKPAETQSASAKAESAAAETEVSSAVEETAGDETAAVSDSGEPSVVIELGDAEALEALAKQAQNFDIEEGTAARIHGIFSEGISTPSVQEQREDGSYIGLSMYVEGEWTAPADKTEIDVTGVFIAGQYFMEFHADPEDIVVIAPPDDARDEMPGEEADVPAAAGGWTVADSDIITDELYDMFRGAVAEKLDEDGIDYHAISYIGSQVVNGTNHCFIADITRVFESRNYMGLVFLHEGSDGSVFFVNEHELEGIQYANEYDPTTEDFGSYFDYEAAAGLE